LRLTQVANLCFKLDLEPHNVHIEEDTAMFVNFFVGEKADEIL